MVNTSYKHPFHQIFILEIYRLLWGMQEW